MMDDAKITTLIKKYSNLFEKCCKECTNDNGHMLIEKVRDIFKEVCFDIRMEEEFGES